VHSTFGDKPNARVVEYLDDDESLRIPILICPDSPLENFTTYATIGLSDYPMYQNNREFPSRLEIISVGNTGLEWFPNVVSTAAFYIMQNRWLCHPGGTLLNVLNDYALNLDLIHLYFTSPFLWQEELKTLQLETKMVSWLLAIPITDAEYKYIKDYGNEKFEDLLEKSEIDVFDMNRHSAI